MMYARAGLCCLILTRMPLTLPNMWDFFLNFIWYPFFYTTTSYPHHLLESPCPFDPSVPGQFHIFKTTGRNCSALLYSSSLQSYGLWLLFYFLCMLSNDVIFRKTILFTLKKNDRWWLKWSRNRIYFRFSLFDARYESLHLKYMLFLVTFHVVEKLIISDHALLRISHV